jgi:hypothetical protein
VFHEPSATLLCVTVDPPGRAAARRPATAVAFVPSTPLLVPEVAGRAAADLAGLRTAVHDAVGAMLAIRPEVVVVVGPDGHDGVRYGPGDGGSLRGLGVDLDVPFAGRARPGGHATPLAHTLGAWLLDEAGWAGARLGVAPDDLAAALSGLPSTAGVLAVGDGSARRTPKAPGSLDAAAGAFDAAVGTALRNGDAEALAVLDEVEGERLMAAGTGAWRALGAALTGRPVTARLHHDSAPLGVGYLVADWRVG